MAADAKKMTPRPSTQGVPWGSWKEDPTPSSGKRGFGTITTIAIAIGVGVVSCYVLDLHSHTCDSCGRRWRHFGAFNLGDQESHTCSACGQVQWWKSGAPHVLMGPQFASIQSTLPRVDLPPLPIADALPPSPVPPFSSGLAIAAAPATVTRTSPGALTFQPRRFPR